MAQAINCKLDIQVVGGPGVSATSSLSVDAYDRIEVVIPGGPPAKASVAVQPGGAGKVKFLLISADRYSDKLTYDVVDSNKAAGVSGVKLDSQQLLMGGGVGLLGVSPNQLNFANGLGAAQDVTVTILVGRDAT